MSERELDDWPDCPVEGCENKICYGLSSEYCFVHTDGNEHVKRMRIAAINVLPVDYAENE
jgi:hypothetical protein